MKKLYEKSELWFALIWIIAYVVLASIGDNVSATIGVEKCVTLPILLVMSLWLFFFVKSQGLFQKYGLCKSAIPSAKLLFYIPLLVLLTANLWYGIALNRTPVEILLHILSMCCVGFLEEIIFRGFLFQAMAKNGVNSAIIISSITFGFGHIVNLFNGSGAELIPNLLQVLYALAIGFTFMLLYYKSGSLLPCILTHSIFNSLSIFANTAAITPVREIVSALLITLISVAYTLYLALAVKKPQQAK